MWCLLGGRGIKGLNGNGEKNTIKSKFFLKVFVPTPASHMEVQ